MNTDLPDADRSPRGSDADDDEAEIRFSLTALGEAVLAENGPRSRARNFRGFGPCAGPARRMDLRRR